ncbi:hypothetical protein GALMADRAFT_137579 [Galerina marginata CBS 339.88]|uniref:Uncharacterized protein n=1 Tax=Galerina marginata (strain CBS 339.88) TaxID=685588 RepID=A0A067T852_GALM3|nr:hypothetical protein GALMADRAFT_137579 [Galerina marginata CBS 339.88]
MDRHPTSSTWPKQPHQHIHHLGHRVNTATTTDASASTVDIVDASITAYDTDADPVNCNAAALVTPPPPPRMTSTRIHTDDTAIPPLAKRRVAREDTIRTANSERARRCTVDHLLQPLPLGLPARRR